MDGSILIKVLVWAPPILLAVILHELAHGYTAFRLGDPTAARAGRLTLNPLSHVDPFGTVLLPLLLIVSGSSFLFGYARPVPVNFANLRNPRRDMVSVAAAGPLTNLVLAAVSAFLLKLLPPQALTRDSLLAVMLVNSILINVILAVFNMLPLPPLDGGRVAVGVLPRGPARALARLEPYGMLIVFALLMTGQLGYILSPMLSFILHTLLS